MQRRDMIRSLGMLSMHALFPGVLSSFISRSALGEAINYERVFFDREEFDMVKMLIDTILPQTATPSATQAGVHFFLDEVFHKCLSDEEQRSLMQGLNAAIAEWSDLEDKEKFVKKLDVRAYSGDPAFAWFRTIKQYAMVGYFTSREGTTLAGDYQKMPAGFVGEVSIDPTTKVQSKTFLKYYF